MIWSSFTLWSWDVWDRCRSCCASEKERQCKFPLACILRQSWQAEVITEWLTHHHGENLSPPGREIAKSQFTHIQLPGLILLMQSHTQTLTLLTFPCRQPSTCFQSLAAAQPPATASIRRFILHVSKCVTTRRERALISCQTHLLKASKQTEWQHYPGVCVRQRNRENWRNRWHQASV